MAEIKLLTPQDAAKRYNVSIYAIRDWVAKKKIRALYTGSKKKRARYIVAQSIEDYINTGV